MTKPAWFEFKITLGNVIMFLAFAFAFFEGYVRMDERNKATFNQIMVQYSDIKLRLDRIEQIHLKP